MKNVKLLDCTLRDGGYINDWNFGHDVLSGVFERLVLAGVDIIEVGFLDQRRPFDINRSIMPDTESVEKIYGSIDKKNAMIVGMIDFGTCSIENIQPCAESYLDGIRVIFKKHLRKEAIAFCRQLKDLEYKVFVQAVSITSYEHEELLDLVRLVNAFGPYAVSMVDTYGLLDQTLLMSIFKVLDEHMNPEIALGYHAHNNFQLGFSNSTEIFKTQTTRQIFVDATLYGMGKSAGNTPIELITTYMNEHCEKSYDIYQLLEAIEAYIMNIYAKIPWGYTLFYYVSALNKCHPNYVSFLMEKRTLSIRSINEILVSIEPDKKLMYDQKHLEKLYLEYQGLDCDDTEAMELLGSAMQGRDVLLIGPGTSVIKEEQKIARYISVNKPVVIPINFLPNQFSSDYVFISNSKRFEQLFMYLNQKENRTIQTIATSNLLKAKHTFSFVLNYDSLIDSSTDIPDNSLIMLLKVLIRLGVKKVGLAGFDGYSESEMNFFKTNMEYSFIKEKAKYLNTYVKDFLHSSEEDIYIEFVTKTKYEE